MEKTKRFCHWLYPSDETEFRKIAVSKYGSQYGHIAELQHELIDLYKQTHRDTHTQNLRKIGKIADKRLVSLMTELIEFCENWADDKISAAKLNAKITKCAGKDPRTHKNYTAALLDLLYIKHHKEIAGHYTIQKDYIQHKLKEIEG